MAGHGMFITLCYGYSKVWKKQKYGAIMKVQTVSICTCLICITAAGLISGCGAEKQTDVQKGKTTIENQVIEIPKGVAQ